MLVCKNVDHAVDDDAHLVLVHSNIAAVAVMIQTAETKEAKVYPVSIAVSVGNGNNLGAQELVSIEPFSNGTDLVNELLGLKEVNISVVTFWLKEDNYFETAGKRTFIIGGKSKEKWERKTGEIVKYMEITLANVKNSFGKMICSCTRIVRVILNEGMTNSYEKHDDAN